MTYFNEENTIQQMVLDALCGRVQLNMVAEEAAPYGDQLKDWKFIPAEQLQRQFSDVFVGSMVRDALIRNILRPEVILDILQNFTLVATDRKHRRIKIICRYQPGNVS